MPRVLIGGGPGAGKTCLLAELASRGFSTRPDSARTIIAARRAAGLSPRPEPRAFALEILRADIAHHISATAEGGWVFFERGVVDALGMAQGCGALGEAEVQAQLAAFGYHPVAFVLPPWPDIYVTDDERDHSFEHAVAVHDAVLRWYRRCGYTVETVPPLPVPARADHLLQVLARTH
jgi:predicted ATPase